MSKHEISELHQLQALSLNEKVSFLWENICDP